MRFIILAVALGLGACASGTTTTLLAADAATSLAAGDQVVMARTSQSTGDDPLVMLTLTAADGRALRFEEANHAPHDVMAQAPDGPLAQVMGLFGGEQPTLYHARKNENTGEPFLCAPEGPVDIGIYQGEDGVLRIVALTSAFQFEDRDDGTAEAAPYSPDHVCARLRFSPQ